MALEICYTAITSARLAHVDQRLDSLQPIIVVVIQTAHRDALTVALYFVWRFLTFARHPAFASESFWAVPRFQMAKTKNKKQNHKGKTKKNGRDDLKKKVMKEWLQACETIAKRVDRSSRHNEFTP